MQTPLPVTLEDYALVMGLDPCILSGIGDGGSSGCPPLDCSTRNQLYADVEFAIGKVSDAVRSLDSELLLTGKKLTSQIPAFSKNGYKIGRIVTRDLTVPVVFDDTPEGLPPDQLDANGNYCKVIARLEVEVDDLDICETIVGFDVLYEDCSCKRLGVKWCSNVKTVITPPTPEAVGSVEFSLAAPAYNFYMDNGIDRMANVIVRVTTIMETKPRRKYINCMCSAPEESCAKCNGQSFCELCYVETESMYEVYSNSSCGNCSGWISSGRPLFYELDVVFPAIMDAVILDSIVSISNYRKTLNECASCSESAQQRLRRDLGILENSNLDLRANNNYFAWHNGFGIFTPGAKLAWDNIMLKFSVAGVSGAFII